MQRLWAWLLPIGVLRLTADFAWEGQYPQWFNYDAPWEHVVGMFRNDPVMAEIMDAGQRIRERGTRPDRVTRLLEGVTVGLGIAVWVMLIALVISTGHDLGWW